MPQYEINRELVLSTAHITEKDVTFLRSLVEETGAVSSLATAVEGLRYGWRIWSEADIAFHKVHFSPELVSLIQLARQEDCKWLILDRDGPIHDHLPTFEW